MARVEGLSTAAHSCLTVAARWTTHELLVTVDLLDAGR